MRARITRALVITGATLLASSAVLAAAPASQAASDRYALGDSVMLGAKSQLKARGFGAVDAAVSRQAYSGPAALRDRGEKLPENVVVHLGTNGTFPLDVCRKMVKAVGPDRRLFLVTVHVDRSWTKGNNKVIRQCDAEFADDRVYVIDWDWAASRHPSWLYSDGMHLRPEGAKAYARIIDSAIDAAVQAEAAAPTGQAQSAAGSTLDGMHGSGVLQAR